MRDRIQCPECEGYDTTQAHVEWTTEGCVETRYCEECPTQWDNDMQDVIVRNKMEIPE
jgi:hypothetical protein